MRTTLKALALVALGAMLSSCDMRWWSLPAVSSVPDAEPGPSPAKMETSLNAHPVVGMRTRTDRSTPDRFARPGDHEYLVGIVGLCEGSKGVTTALNILPSLIAGIPGVAGGIQATPCVRPPDETSDGFPTVVTGVHLSFSGPAAAGVEAAFVYLDTSSAGLPSNAALFESGELVRVGPVVAGSVSFENTTIPLETAGGAPLVFADGGKNPVASLFYVTATIASAAVSGSVTMTFSLIVKNVLNLTSSGLTGGAPVLTFEVLGNTASPSPPPSASSMLKGDVNLDGELGYQDISLLSRATRGRLQLSPQAQAAGDVALPCAQLNRADVRYLIRMVESAALAQCP